jgi:hypothetical protein
VSPWAEVLRDLSYGTLDRLRLDLVAEQERRGARFDAGDVPRVHAPTADRPFRMVPVGACPRCGKAWKVGETCGPSVLAEQAEEPLRCTAQAGHVSENCWCRQSAQAELASLRASLTAAVFERDANGRLLRDVIRACRDEADRGLTHAGEEEASFFESSLSRILAACRAAVGAS